MRRWFRWPAISVDVHEATVNFPIRYVRTILCMPCAVLSKMLRRRGVKNLVLTGVTADVRLHTIMRSANDMGYECVLLEMGA